MESPIQKVAAVLVDPRPPHILAGNSNALASRAAEQIEVASEVGEAAEAPVPEWLFRLASVYLFLVCVLGVLLNGAVIVIFAKTRTVGICSHQVVNVGLKDFLLKLPDAKAGRLYPVLQNF